MPNSSASSSERLVLNDPYSTESVTGPVPRDWEEESSGQLEAARAIFDQQAEAVAALGRNLGDSFQQAAELILATDGHVVVVGMGKSGLIGQKLAATFASTGTPSFAVHPGEAYHGDLGMIRSDDAVLMLSYSGETEEVVRLIPHLKRRGVNIIALVGNADSSLGRGADVALAVPVSSEVCPHNLAPTTSTLATLAMGDALAVSLMRLRGFGPMDFARFHPGGSLGQRLLRRVSDVMRTRDLPLIDGHETVREALLVMSAGRMGIVVVTNCGELSGILTDGDLRRHLQATPEILDRKVSSVMTSEPLTVSPETSLHEAQTRMHDARVSALVVVGRDGEIEGVLDTYCR